MRDLGDQHPAGGTDGYTLFIIILRITIFANIVDTIITFLQYYNSSKTIFKKKMFYSDITWPYPVAVCAIVCMCSVGATTQARLSHVFTEVLKRELVSQVSLPRRAPLFITFSFRV